MQGTQPERKADEMAAALAAARTFLYRWRDAFTRAHADDLAQDAVIEVWRRRSTLRRPDRLGAYVRTVCRRRRYRAIAEHMRNRAVSLEANRKLVDRLSDQTRQPPSVLVGGRAIARESCVAELDWVLRQIGSLNGRIVLGYYQGFSCGELAQRYRLPEKAVKVRLHRSRHRIRKVFEGYFKTSDENREERNHRQGRTRR